MFEYRKETKTVEEFLAMFQYIDCNPTHQRPDREPNMKGTTSPSKAQGIIASMLMGMDIGQITIHETPDREYEFESIDGGHRKRYIHAFVNNEFPDFESKKLFKQLSSEEKESFFNIELTFCIYKNLLGPQVGRIFRTLNETTPVNHQEMLNSYGDIPIANAIREMVRVIPGVGNIPNELFDYRQVNSSSKKVYTNLSFNNSGLKIDEMVARIFYRYYDGGGLGTSCDKDLEKLYEANISSDQVEILEKKVKACLKFIKTMAWARKTRLGSPLTQKEFVLYCRLFLYLEKKHSVFSIEDAIKFFDTINERYIVYRSYNLHEGELEEESPFDESKTIGKQFNDSLGEFRPAKSVKFPIDRLTKEININDLIVVKDTKRKFSKIQRENKLIQQDYRCAISNEPLEMKDAHAAHKIAWSEGGSTSDDNLAMVHKRHNTRMGTMSFEEYKKMQEKVS